MFYDLFCELCRKKGVSPTRATIEIGLSRTIGTKWKTTGATPQGETLSKIADYFGVSVDYLLGNAQKGKAPVLTKKDERDIEKRLEAMIGDLEGGTDGLMFSGEPLDEETRELLRISLRNQLEISKRIAKQKFTPKKYRKEGK